MTKPQLEKVQFHDPDVGYENLWAERDRAGFYVIKSVPYFIYNIALGDTVRVKRDEENESLSFSEVIKRSGHTTIRARPSNFTIDEPQGKVLMNAIEGLGGVIEVLPPHLIAIDIPQQESVESITVTLTNQSVPWEWGFQAK